jgi:RimJ/RimL family protein N-acetyltransferase
MPEFEHLNITLPDEVVGERIVLRPWWESDAEAFYAEVERSRAHISRWLPWPDEYHSVEDARPFLRRSAAQWLLREEFVLGIFTHEGQLVGSVGLHPRNWKAPSFEIGYWLGQSFEGKGYMSEAVRLATKLAFESLEANRVMIRCDVANERSAAVARRCGYVYEGTIRNDTVLPPRIVRDSLWFSMIPEDYQKLKPQGETKDTP